jgi:hypothetical protein
MPRFHVRDTFAIRDKNLFVLAGFAIEGEIKAGMIVRLPFSPTIMMTEVIDHLQHVQRPDGDVVCLCLRCRSAQEAALWDALKIKDHTIDIAPAP